MSNATGTLKIWQRFAGAPGGKWAFSKLVCMKAPYFSSIQPLFEEIKPGYCTVRMPKRRAVLNHLGTVHAIAMCNMAELSGGTMTEVQFRQPTDGFPRARSVSTFKRPAQIWWRVRPLKNQMIGQ